MQLTERDCLNRRTEELFCLNEINSMPYELQAKLLRVLQEGYVRRE